jgi:hypothetical protein
MAAKQIYMRQLAYTLGFIIAIPLITFGQELAYDGLYGYLYSRSEIPPEEYNKGYGLYTAIWPLIDEPIQGFQIGLPGYWIIPDNTDNKTTSLCPPGTLAFEYWPERGPTYQDVFQTIEGGAGYWAVDWFPTHSPKFSIGGTCDCYTTISKTNLDKQGPVPDLNIAQLSNRILTPYDNLPLKGTPNGDFFGYSYVALPLSPEKNDPWITGDLSWTLFINTANFKGPVIYYLPESWSRISAGYAFDIRRGLDARGLLTGQSGTMEINTVPMYTLNRNGKRFSKIPRLNFPYNHPEGSILTRDVYYFSQQALYDSLQQWARGASTKFPSGEFHKTGSFRAKIFAPERIDYEQEALPITGINEVARPYTFDEYSFGLKWSIPTHTFPQYFEATSGGRKAIAADKVPKSLQQTKFERRTPSNEVYQVNISQWPVAPVAGPFSIQLTDKSLVTYYWYRFADQPALQESTLTDGEKEKLQQLVENIHRFWTPEKEYMPAPASGALVSVDDAIIVTPPPGLEVGYVPIVTRQELGIITDAEKNAEEHSVSAYPNPTPGRLNVISSTPVSSIFVFDYLGRLEAQFNTLTFDLHSLKAGLKFVQIMFTNGTSKTIKVVKY